MLANNQLDFKYVESYVFQKKATVTIRSKKSGEHFTYNIVKDKYADYYRIYLLVGDDNERSFRYIGLYYRDKRYYHLPSLYREGNQQVALSIQVIRYVLQNINNLPDTIEVYHSCKCALCGRKLTTPASLRTGFGPKCIKWVEV